MAASAQLDAVSELHDSDHIPVFLSEQGNCTHCLRLLHRGVSLLFESEVLADEGVDFFLHEADLLVGHLLEMREVEAEIVVADIGTLLLDMGAENLPEHLVEKVGAAVVVGDLLPALCVDAESGW